MRKFSLISLVVLLTFGLIATFTGCPGQTPAPTKAPETNVPTSTTVPPATIKTLKIGGSMPLSGPPSAAGIAFKQGWEMAVDKINDEGGLKIGDDIYMIELLVEDSKGTPEGGTAAATKLVLQEGVKFYVGDLIDYMTPPIYKITSSNGALFCETLCSNSAAVPGSYADVGPDKPLFIRTSPATDETDINPYTYVVDKYPDVKKVAIFNMDFADYDNNFEKLKADIAPLGFEVVGNYERFSVDVVDFTPLMTRILQNNPDAIHCLRMALAQFPLIVKTARDAGFNGPLLFSSPSDPDYATSVGPDISDVITNGLYMNAPNLPDTLKTTIELGRAKYGNENFVSDSLMAYDQIMIMAQVMVKAQSVDPQIVQDTFEILTEPGDLQSIFGQAYVGGMETTGVNRVVVKPWPLSRLHNGQGEFVKFINIDIP